MARTMNDLYGVEADVRESAPRGTTPMSDDVERFADTELVGRRRRSAEWWLWLAVSLAKAAAAALGWLVVQSTKRSGEDAPRASHPNALASAEHVELEPSAIDGAPSAAPRIVPAPPAPDRFVPSAPPKSAAQPRRNTSGKTRPDAPRGTSSTGKDWNLDSPLPPM
jgi:hypothetical protein